MLRLALLFLAPYVLFSTSFAQKKYETDVLVVGGSTGGTAAGIQSARMGVNTIIVEPTTWLGGMLTAAGVSCTDGNDELHSGIWQEFREALYKHYGKRNLFTGWVSKTCFEPSVGDSIFKAWAKQEKKLTVLYGWYFDRVLKNANRVTGALFVNKKGEKISINAKLTMDGTDLGDVYANAGEGYDIGMEDKNYSKEAMAPGKNNIIQDLTWAAVLKDYGKETDASIPRPANYDSTLFFCCCTDAPCNGKPWNGNAQKMLDYGKLSNGKFMLNWPPHGNDYYINVIDLRQIDREKALQPARDKTLGFVYFIQTQLGFKHIGLFNEFDSEDKLALIPYHREGRRMRGVVRLNVNHLTHPFDQPEKLYRTGISVGDYPVDHHHAPEKKAPGIDFPPVPSFNVPLGTLVPAKVEGLLACEKGISVSNIVNGSTRLQPCVLLTGQAAGVLAALAITKNKSPRSVSVRLVQQHLLKSGAYIMPYVDVMRSDPHWAVIQRIGATGIIRGFGKPEGWANKTYFYPDSTISEKELSIGLFEFEKKFPHQHYQSAGPLTINHAWKMITEMQHHLQNRLGIPHKYPPIVSEEWRTVLRDKLGIENIDRNKLITRKELAVLLDNLSINLFSLEVDHWGNLMTVTKK